MKKHLTTIILLASVCLNIVLAVMAFRDETSRGIVGTFSTNSAAPENSTYLACEQDGSYVLYRQFEIIQQGRLKQESSDVFTLLVNSSDAPLSPAGFAVLTGEDTLNLLGTCLGEARVLTKTGSVPVYINLPEHS